MSVLPSILLASNSPRRKELLGWTGLAFSVRAVDIDETVLEGESPSTYVSRLAFQKAQAAAKRTPGQLILAADTTVADGQEILGKPVDREDAKRMLLQLRGHVHWVHTALTLIDGDTGKSISELCTTPVEMREYTDAELERYLDTNDPLDKAGAYAIQHTEFHPVIHMTGCFASVIGLPLCHLVRGLRKLGADDLSAIPAACQKNLRYDCPVTQQILNEK